MLGSNTYFEKATGCTLSISFEVRWLRRSAVLCYDVDVA
jgi:hypothetical protein